MIIENDPRMLSFLNDYELDGDHKKLYMNFLSLAKNAKNWNLIMEKHFELNDLLFEPETKSVISEHVVIAQTSELILENSLTMDPSYRESYSLYCYRWDCFDSDGSFYCFSCLSPFFKD